MNYYELLERLRAVADDDAEFEARILIENYTDLSYNFIRLNPRLSIESRDLEDVLQKRESRVPLQYILGRWDFYRQTYYVNENCLIPRSDTELLVEKAVELLPRDAHFLDLCTGSGCIAISALAERTDTSAVMVDKFPKTLDIAKKNAILNGVENRVDPILLDVLSEEQKLDGREFDAILSNPPYIRPDVIETLSPEVKKEPYDALYGGEDGLIFYNKIIFSYSKFLKKDGFFLFEIGYDQAKDLQRIAYENGFHCKIFKDYGGNDRIAWLTK